MKVLNLPMSLLLLLLVTACVTINVYFPAEAAVKAADRIILDVYGEKPDSKDEEKPAAAEPTSWRQDTGKTTPVAVHILNWLVAPAHAEADISIDTPAIRQLKAKMEQRHRQLAAHYASGAVGMTGDGRITLRDQKLVPLSERNSVKGLVSQENGDRDALYAEIARANGHPEWESDIRQTFARRWVANARSGWYYMDGGAWKQK
ncbi:MAG: YdbL family protein [Gammaproteobacteria bacterium]|nr:YdbL family protein [Gammaproteobacteria bacterium]